MTNRSERDFKFSVGSDLPWPLRPTEVPKKSRGAPRMSRWIQYPMKLIRYRLADILRGRFDLPYRVNIAEHVG